MRIAICDDEKTYIEKLKNDINSLQTHETNSNFQNSKAENHLLNNFQKINMI